MASTTAFWILYLWIFIKWLKYIIIYQSLCILSLVSKNSINFRFFQFFFYFSVKPVDRLLELQKFFKQSDFREILCKKIFFFRTINLELSIVCLYLPKNKALRSHNHSQKVKNDSCSTYAKVQNIVSIGQLVNKLSWLIPFSLRSHKGQVLIAQP